MHHSSPHENQNQGISEHPLHDARKRDHQFNLNTYLGVGRPRERAIYLIETGIVEFDFETDRFKVQRQPAARSRFLTKWEKWTLWNRADRLCNYCHKSKPLVVEHIIPFTAWPEAYAWLADDASNLTMSCRKCNKKKSNHYWNAGVTKNSLSTECEWCYSSRIYREGKYSCSHAEDYALSCEACNDCEHGNSCNLAMSTCMKCCMDEYSPVCRMPIFDKDRQAFPNPFGWEF